jgi:drug/metabolite transporter (DMT)-like permease
MALHQASGRWQLGLLLAFATAMFWATLPVALKIVLVELDPFTLTWFRFVFAAIGLGLWIGFRGGFSVFRRLSQRSWWLLLVAALMLIGNYVFYVLGLAHTTPANAQLLIQLAPLLMALGGLIVFGERFNTGQWLGFAGVSVGLLLFFRDQVLAIGGQSQYLIGVGLIVIAAVVWAVYALAQKQLLAALGSPAALWFIYVLASVVLLPTANPSSLSTLNAGAWIALLYCAINTLGAYGAFAEALAHWEASRVSAVLALTPLMTMLTVDIAHRVNPVLVAPERIGWIGLLGALLVVAGSAATSLLGRKVAS